MSSTKYIQCIAKILFKKIEQKKKNRLFHVYLTYGICMYVCMIQPSATTTIIQSSYIQLSKIFFFLGESHLLPDK